MTSEDGKMLKTKILAELTANHGLWQNWIYVALLQANPFTGLIGSEPSLKLY